MERKYFFFQLILYNSLFFLFDYDFISFILGLFISMFINYIIYFVLKYKIIDLICFFMIILLFWT